MVTALLCRVRAFPGPGFFSLSPISCSLEALHPRATSEKEGKEKGVSRFRKNIFTKSNSYDSAGGAVPLDSS